jgi:hypothetical protein
MNEPRHIGDLIAERLNKKPCVGISLDRTHLEFYQQDRVEYEIPLTRFDSPAKLMDMTAFIAAKNWTTKDTLLAMISQVAEFYDWKNQPSYTQTFNQS